MRKNRILKRIQADLSNEELNNNYKLSKDSTMLKNHYKICNSYAKKFAELLEDFEYLKGEMDSFSLPSLYTHMTEDEFINDYFTNRTAFAQCCVDTDAEYYYSELRNICKELINVSNALEKNLLPSDYFNW